MENLTYRMYLANPALREQIEREVRSARAEVMYRYIVAPLVRMFRRPTRRPAGKTEISLARGDLLRLENARDTRVRVEQGALWITQEGDTSDVVLSRGESYRLDRDGLALLHACYAPLTRISLAPAN